MARPKCCRKISGEEPRSVVFKPVGVPVASLEEVLLTMDEFEAIRLADLLGLYHEQAAARMGVSRQTFGRIISSARSKIARVLMEGLALRIAGGTVERCDEHDFCCLCCRHVWNVPAGVGRPDSCPACRSSQICCRR